MPGSTSGKRTVWLWLIFWFGKSRNELGTVTVVPSAKLPAKFRKEGFEGDLTWIDDDKKKSVHRVRIVKRGGE